MGKRYSKSPWCWIPTLYIAEGLPYFAVNTLTVLMYTRMGVGLKEMAFFTGWLYLPWVIKPFWSPFVDVISTKRKWTIAMQLFIAISMACVAFLLPFSFFFVSTLIVFWLMAFFSATHDIGADGYYMLELTEHDQAAYVGVRSTFYRIASVIGQGGLVILAGILEEKTANIPLSWSIVFGILSIFFFAIVAWHTFGMPKAEADTPSKNTTPREIMRGFGDSWITFFTKSGILAALFFMLFFRFPEAMCVKIIQPFLVTPQAEGGLGLTTLEVGFVNGTVGVVALLLGGIIGGIAISIKGLKFWLWPMAASLTLPCVFYCFLAMWQPSSFFWICAAVAVEQFGYGFGFTAFMLYLIYFSRGKDKTSHYAFCTGFMALGMMIPGMYAGWMHEFLSQYNLMGLEGPQGYVNFFWWIMASCLFTFLACAFVKIPADFGKKQK